MEALDIFLRALEHRLGFKDKFFVCKSETTSDIKFPAYKTCKLEIWCSDGNYNERISTVVTKQRYVSQEEKQYIEKKNGQKYNKL